jgi:hypothetical protein
MRLAGQSIGRLGLQRRHGWQSAGEHDGVRWTVVGSWKAW